MIVNSSIPPKRKLHPNQTSTAKTGYQLNEKHLLRFPLEKKSSPSLQIMHCVVELTRTPDLDRNWKVQLLDNWYIAYQSTTYNTFFKQKPRWIKQNVLNLELWESTKSWGIQTTDPNLTIEQNLRHVHLLVIDKQQITSSNLEKTVLYNFPHLSLRTAGCAGVMAIAAEEPSGQGGQGGVEHPQGWKNQSKSKRTVFAPDYVTMWIGHCHCFFLKSVKKTLNHSIKPFLNILVLH